MLRKTHTQPSPLKKHFRTPFRPVKANKRPKDLKLKWKKKINKKKTKQKKRKKNPEKTRYGTIKIA